MLQDRILCAQKALSDYDFDAFLVEKTEDIAYFLHDEAISGILLIGKNEIVFFIHKMDKDLYAHITRVPIIFLSKDPYQELSTYIENFGYATVGFDSLSTSYQKFEERRSLPCSWKPIIQFTEKLRCIKSPQEIEKMQEAATLGSEGYDYVLTLLREGVTEKEIVRKLRTFWAQAGAEGPSFPPIIAFGEHAAFPHAIPTNRPLRQGDIVLIDIGVLLNGYCSDMTRVVSWGRPHKKLLESYSILVEVQKQTIALCKEGILWTEVHEYAVGLLQAYKLDHYFFHGIGHGIGRNVHEYPGLRPGSVAELKSGMTVTVEPGVYFPGIGGIRIEDTLCINGNKNINLTKRPVSPELICL
ncbi:M24 family metallopeptidase [Candidatus Chlamydia sanziniae]|uniref:Aminopeptidase YpdF n=1 Tax=Candidatus Chlamydia sanziniae TaxID=1806891 RepID=A0A1A9HWY2_9CHLA|nr:Xaa-Pro peptidase family protein [Candidatus Chlamydia sanziniae]ANH78613.1 Aminopeptidase YpdF [Candidatus Chlamydia sanziniae]